MSFLGSSSLKLYLWQSDISEFLNITKGCSTDVFQNRAVSGKSIKKSMTLFSVRYLPQTILYEKISDSSRPYFFNRNVLGTYISITYYASLQKRLHVHFKNWIDPRLIHSKLISKSEHTSIMSKWKSL